MARPRKAVKARPPPNEPVGNAPAREKPVVAPPPQVKAQLLAPSEPVLPTSPEDIVHNVTCRQLADEAKVPDAIVEPDPVLSGMRSIVDALRSGASMVEHKPLLDRFARANDQVAQVIGTMYVRHQFERLVSNLEAQDVLERFLHRCLKRGDLNAREALVFLGMVRSEIKAITSGLSRQAREGIPDVDSDVALEKMDYRAQQVQAEAADLFKDTTARGREIVRKLIAERRKKLNLA